MTEELATEGKISNPDEETAEEVYFDKQK